MILIELWNHIAQNWSSQELLPIPELMNASIVVPPFDATLPFLTVGDCSLDSLRKSNQNEKFYHDLRKYIRDIDLALRLGHKAEIIHSDVGPRNIVVIKEENRGILIDWGMAVHIGEASKGGTLLYSSLRMLHARYSGQPYYPNEADDFEALFYTYIDLVVPRLDWKHERLKDLYLQKTNSICLNFEELIQNWKKSYQQVPDAIWNDLTQMHKLLFPTNNYKNIPKMTGLFSEDN